MQYRLLGRTGVYVSELSLGAMTFGGSGNPMWGPIAGVSFADADRIVNTALDAGVNLIDTADVYASGESEEYLGRILKKRNRNDVLLATKVHGRTGMGPNDVGQSRLHVMHSLEESLRRLQTDHIDVYQIHDFDYLTPLEDTLRALDDGVRQGKVRYIACSNIAAWQVTKALGLSALNHLSSFVSIQSNYSLLSRDVEHEIVPMVQSEGLGLTVWGPLGGGFLTGKIDREKTPDATSRRGHPDYPDFPPVNRERAFEIVDVLKTVAARHEASVSQVAHAWLLSQSAVTSVTIGVRTVEQLTDNLGSVDLKLTDEDLSQLDQVSRPALQFPYWVQKMNAAYRFPL